MKENLAFLFLLAIFCVASAFAQKNMPMYECQEYDKPDFVAEKIDVDVTDAPLRDILNYFTEQFGSHFVVDEKTSEIRVTTILKDIPWNIALNSILESKNLAMQQVGIVESKLIFRVGKPLKLSGMYCKFPEKKVDDSTLFTEFIKIENLPSCINKETCGRTSMILDYLKSAVGRRLSKRGEIEFDERSRTLIVTDVRSNLDAIKSLVKILDTEEFYDQAIKSLIKILDTEEFCNEAEKSK